MPHCSVCYTLLVYLLVDNQEVCQKISDYNQTVPETQLVLFQGILVFITAINVLVEDGVKLKIIQLNNAYSLKKEHRYKYSKV
ncbi:hypothetical protein GCM10027293_13830 [Pontibacter aydingkolensis]